LNIILAGYNVDARVLEELTRGTDRDDVTPETISAAYARISRDPRSVDELRRIARLEVEKARKSNRSIVFGMGHHSVAEHAVFNFDLIGVSRLAIEEIERFRLCSYTEKSQRYIALESEYVTPDEISGSHLEKLFAGAVRDQYALYHKLYEKLKKESRAGMPRGDASREESKATEGTAREDARYITPLATSGQLGETINARNLELLLRRFASHELHEVREIGRRMYECVADVAPSLIIYPSLRSVFTEMAAGELRSGESPEVELVDYTKDADLALIASLLHTTTDLGYSKCRELSGSLEEGQRLEAVKTALEHMELYDAVLREFEYVHLTFDLVLSASCFAQLKRHRMATITAQGYNPELGITIPPSICDCGMARDFSSVAKRTEEAYYALLDQIPIAAPYVLTNAHRRRVLLGLNARELYHMSRLREDATAQWEIRLLTRKMTELAGKVMPLTMLLIGGKDSYPALYEKVYGRPPKIVNPELPS
jgi:flavin-dependent thymidylate synthase